MCPNNKSGDERIRLGFADAAEEAFAFLYDLGFSRIESSATLVRFTKGELEVSVYHGRRSFEIGFEIARQGFRYSMSELIRVTNCEAAERYRNFVPTTSERIVEGLVRLKEFVRQYAEPALRDDPEFFAALEKQRRQWSQSYALDVLASQLRPKPMKRSDLAITRKQRTSMNESKIV